jgi:hypothetical protein
LLARSLASWTTEGSRTAARAGTAQFTRRQKRNGAQALAGVWEHLRSVRITKDRPSEDPDDGRCRICGTEGPLTFEHVPPKAAYNNQRAEMLGLDAWLERHEDGTPGARGKILQRGSGVYTLCEACNNRAGQLYVPELAKWTRIGMKVLYRDGVATSADNELDPSWTNLTIEDVRPARLLKQIATMMLAISPPWFVREVPELAAYARDPDIAGFPERLRIYLALYAGPWARFVGGAARLSGLEDDGVPAADEVHEHFVFEIAYPPYAYIMSLDEETPAAETVNITNFADLRIDPHAKKAEVMLLNGFGYTAVPLDYRTKPALLRDRAAQQEQPE